MIIHLIDYAIISFTSLFVIVDPIGLIPVFLSMTETNTVKERIRMTSIASVLTFFILLLSAFVGQKIFSIFGITISAFEIGGGIILLIVALDMVQAKRTAVKATAEEQSEGLQKDNIAVTPLTIPMLAGPGAITAVILLAAKATSGYHLLILAGSIFLVSLISYLILRTVSIHSRILSVIVMNVITRLMGLLLTAIAVQFILNGIASARVF